MDLTMGGQFALIPAKVLYDDNLPATAKLLYGEIYRLSYANGYCYATNKDFERLLKRSSSTVSDLLKSLADGGYIRVKQIRRNGDTGDIIQRRIFCGQTLAPEDPKEDLLGIPENRDTYPGKSGEGIPENRKATNLKKNNNIPPIVPQGESRQKFIPPTLEEVRAYCQQRRNGISPQEFIDYYTANGWMRGKTRIKDWQAAVRTWENRRKRDAFPTSDSSDAGRRGGMRWK